MSPTFFRSDSSSKGGAARDQSGEEVERRARPSWPGAPCAVSTLFTEMARLRTRARSLPRRAFQRRPQRSVVAVTRTRTRPRPCGSASGESRPVFFARSTSQLYRAIRTWRSPGRPVTVAVSSNGRAQPLPESPRGARPGVPKPGPMTAESWRARDRTAPASGGPARPFGSSLEGHLLLGPSEMSDGAARPKRS